MSESGTIAKLTFDSKGQSSLTKSFPIEVARTSISTWGCPFIGSGYLKKYKVGQGSYGFEFVDNG